MFEESVRGVTCRSSNRNRRALPRAREEAVCVQQALALGPRKGEHMGLKIRAVCVEDFIWSLTCLASSPGDVIMYDHRQITFFL